MDLIKTYRYRIYPTPYQEQLLLRQAGACRWVWNWALRRKIDEYEKTKKSLSWSKLANDLVLLKKQEDTKWLKECESQSLLQSLQNLDRSYQSFFRRVKNGEKPGFPKFKSKHRCRPSFRCIQSIRIKANKIWVPTIDWIEIKLHRPLEHQFKSVTFKQNSCGHWYVTLVTHFEILNTQIPLPPEEKVVGIDVGLKDFATFSDNFEPIQIPKFFRKMERKLQRSNKAFSRSQKGSKRREKKRLKLAKIYEKITNQRKDFLHKQSTRIVNKYEGICVESLNLKALTRTKLAKSFNDAAHGEFARQLEYKCLWNRKHFQKVDRWYPSSKLCSICGFVNQKLELSDRRWFCDGCNALHDRDKNAAINIQREGYKLLVAGYANNSNARGDGVRPMVVNQSEATVDETRTTVDVTIMKLESKLR